MEICKKSGKVCHPTKQKAYKEALKLRGPNGREANNVYKCSACKMYHLAHLKAVAKGRQKN